MADLNCFAIWDQLSAFPLKLVRAFCLFQTILLYILPYTQVLPIISWYPIKIWSGVELIWKSMNYPILDRVQEFAGTSQCRLVSAKMELQAINERGDLYVVWICAGVWLHKVRTCFSLSSRACSFQLICLITFLVITFQGLIYFFFCFSRTVKLWN